MKIIEIISESEVDESNLAPITSAEARKILSNMGYKFVRQKGSHEQWSHPDGHTYPLSPHGKELKTNRIHDLRKLMKQRGYNPS